ncbi:type II secretion system protein GspA, partial [Escherichia coli]|nr:type II secretion system protein GspA [Escherichia coli]
WLCEKRQTWRLCYLLGEAGSGKTWLAQQLQKDKHRRVITLSLVVSWQGKAAWIVTDDNAAEQGCRDSAWTRDEMAGQLLHALHRTDSRCPLIIIENAHLNHRRILDDLQRAISLIPDGQFLLIGRPDRKVERDFKKQGIDLVSIGRLTEHELKASILEGQNIDQPDLLLTARVLKRIALLCRGDRRKLALAG